MLESVYILHFKDIVSPYLVIYITLKHKGYRLMALAQLLYLYNTLNFNPDMRFHKNL